MFWVDFYFERVGGLKMIDVICEIFFYEVYDCSEIYDLF